MVGLKDIYQAINGLLAKNYPKIPVYANEIDQGFARDCFFVKVHPMLRENTTLNFITIKMLVDIKYFNQMGQELELIRMYDGLNKVFKMNLPVLDRYLYIKNTRGAFLEDKVLQFNFDLDYMIMNPTEEERLELMRVLRFKIEKE